MQRSSYISSYITANLKEPSFAAPLKLSDLGALFKKSHFGMSRKTNACLGQTQTEPSRPAASENISRPATAGRVEPEPETVFPEPLSVSQQCKILVDTYKPFDEAKPVTDQPKGYFSFKLGLPKKTESFTTEDILLGIFRPILFEMKRKQDAEDQRAHELFMAQFTKPACPEPTSITSTVVSEPPVVDDGWTTVQKGKSSKTFKPKALAGHTIPGALKTMTKSTKTSVMTFVPALSALGPSNTKKYNTYEALDVEDLTQSSASESEDIFSSPSSVCEF
ncbi:hypothetical protein FT663_05205 [Candidozyma haemuli var. vulneris]|nr:hypothetical protein FT663_05205 [[Candida] haemuloni var. vulneris]KAF3991243.1 hypothetical protein FT662_01794 [[Candida] haemuloni var. vulneris]